MHPEASGPDLCSTWSVGESRVLIHCECHSDQSLVKIKSDCRDDFTINLAY